MSMNHLCGCTGVPASTLELPKHREISNSCKICGGKQLVDGQRALPGSMLSNIGLEISGIIDPHLNWKMASKSKPRAVRRARTSFTSIIKGQSLEKVPEENENLITKESMRSKEMPVSEFEKLGVTILGQRFSDTIESVPIKKRRFFFRSPSPSPPHPPFLGDESGHTSVSQVTSNESGTAQDSNTKHHLLKISGVYKTGLDEEKTDLDDIEERLCDTADFSGISILAAAACNSSSGDDVVTNESLYSKQCSFRTDGLIRISESQSGNENKTIKEQVCDVAPILDDKINVPSDNSAKLSCRGEDVAKKVSSSLGEGSSRSLLDVLNKDNEGLGGMGSSRDDRFHWDLNTVMEAWETPYDDSIMDPQPVPFNVVNEDDIHGDKVVKQENLEGNIVQDHSNSVGKIVNKRVDFGRLSVCNSEGENLVKADSPCNGSFPDHDDGSVQEHQMGCASEEVTTDTNPSGIGSSMEIEIGVNLHLNGSSSTQNPVCVSEPHSVMDTTTNEIVPSQKAFIGSKVDLCKCSDDCRSADVQIGEIVRAVEAVCSHPDQDACRLDDCNVGPIAEQASSILGDGDLCKVATGDDAGQTEPFSEKKTSVVHQLTEAGKSSCQQKPVASMSHGLINDEENSSGHTAKNEWVNSEKAGLQGSRTALTDENGDCVQFDHHGHIESKDLLTPNVADGCPLTTASHATYKNCNGNFVSSPVENVFDDAFDCDYYSDTSQNEQATGMEKIDQQADDESQYEDGEFRESFVHSWEMDGCDEGEAEHVDYGSDNKEIDAFEAASDCPVPNSFSQVGHFEHNNEGLLEYSRVDECHNVEELKVKPMSFLSSDAVGSDVGVTYQKGVGVMKEVQSAVQSRRKYAYMKWEKSTKDATESGAPIDKLLEDKEFVEEGDGMRKRSHSASLRMKSSGWDRMPACRRSCGDEAADSGMDNYDAAPEKLQVTGSTLKRELSSRIGRPKSPDILHRKVRASFQGTRNRDSSNDLHHNVKRDVNLGISVRRDNPSVHMHCGGRGDRWIESSSHQGPSHHESPRYYSRAGLTRTGSKNAAAVSIAKVESNGFVVAPDGTVLEASGVAPSGHLPRRSSSSNARRTLKRRASLIERDETLSFESQLDLGSRRELSPGRHISIGHGRPGRYGSKPVSEGNIERYHGFAPDDSVGSSLPVHHSFSSRERSFSPQTRPGQVSRRLTRSRSRSRTHSPPAWTSPRRSNLINNGLRRRTRSPPDFRSEARVERVRSPHGRSGFAGRVTSFAPSPRNHASPLRASRWINERKELIEHFRGPDYRRFSGRSPPKRLFSRRHRFNPVDSSGRLKPDEFYRLPIHSGRFSEFNVGRGRRPDGGDGDRRHLDRYEMLPSERQYDILGDVKRLRYETEDRFEPHIDCSKNAPEFSERESPRNFDRVVANQLNNSHSRAKEETSHFRYGRDGKHKASYKASYKAFDIQECDEDGTQRRRRHS